MFAAGCRTFSHGEFEASMRYQRWRSKGKEVLMPDWKVPSVRSACRISLFCLIGCGFAGAALAGTKPNVIVVFTDDHGYADLGCQGVLPDVTTPNLDSLANDGVRMECGYVTAPQCVPSRGGLLSGQYQNKFGLESNTQFNEPGGLDGFGAVQTVAERLKAAGYATGMAGKWHLGPPSQIVDHGFDKLFYKNSDRAGLANFDLQGNDVPLGPESNGIYHLDACSQAACVFIERFRDQPFFFYLAYRAPHVPLDPPEAYLSRFPGEMPERRRKALAMLAAVDDGVGRIVQTLRKYELEENTLIFFISDNGAPLKIHRADAPGIGPGWDGSLNDPLNGEKGMLTEGGIRTPFVLRWKERIPAGQVYSHPVISLDVAATAIAVAGLPDDASLDGVNLIPYLTGEAKGAPHDALYWRWNGQAAIRRGQWKYLRGGQRQYLFDLISDPEEKRNLIDEHASLAASLRDQWDDWAKTLKPPGLQPSISGAANQYFDWYLDGKRTPAAVDGTARPAAAEAKPRTSTPRRTRRPMTVGELFDRRDADGDGEVTFREFLEGREDAPRGPLERRFQSLDRNRDGRWTRSDLQAAEIQKE
jgi:uncharacterized sulfatase